MRRSNFAQNKPYFIFIGNQRPRSTIQVRTVHRPPNGAVMIITRVINPGVEPRTLELALKHFTTEPRLFPNKPYSL